MANDFGRRGSDEHGMTRAEMQDTVKELMAPVLGVGVTTLASADTSRARARFARAVMHEIAKIAPPGMSPASFISDCAGNVAYSMRAEAGPAEESDETVDDDEESDEESESADEAF